MDGPDANRRREALRQQLALSQLNAFKAQLAAAFSLAQIAASAYKIGDRARADQSIVEGEEAYTRLVVRMADSKSVAGLREEDIRWLQSELARLRRTLDVLEREKGTSQMSPPARERPR